MMENSFITQNKEIFMGIKHSQFGQSEEHKGEVYEG